MGDNIAKGREKDQRLFQDASLSRYEPNNLAREACLRYAKDKYKEWFRSRCLMRSVWPLSLQVGASSKLSLGDRFMGVR